MTEIFITDTIIIYNDMERGWVRGNTQPLWHRTVYDMWKKMWVRVYTGLHWFGRTIQPEYKYLSNYVNDIIKLDNFDLFKENPKGWCIDKDIKGGTYEGYYFQYLSLITRRENANEVWSTREKRYVQPLVPIIAISLKDNTILFFKSAKYAKSLGFRSSGICNCIKGRFKSYRGYRWFYLDWSDYLDNIRVG